MNVPRLVYREEKARQEVPNPRERTKRPNYKRQQYFEDVKHETINSQAPHDWVLSRAGQNILAKTSWQKMQ